jgi:hypothetical protein
MGAGDVSVAKEQKPTHPVGIRRSPASIKNSKHEERREGKKSRSRTDRRRACNGDTKRYGTVTDQEDGRRPESTTWWLEGTEN